MKHISFLFILFFVAIQLSAEITMPAIFSNNMVLQRETEVSVWGEVDPNERVTVMGSWSNEKAKTVADSIGNWRIKIKLLMPEDHIN